MSDFAFLDTGALYAMAHRKNRDHAAARAVYANAKWRFITHEFVLVETFSLLAKRLHKRAAISMIDAVRRSPRVEIVPATTRLLQSGWERATRFRDKEWDWVDCMSFTVMEERGIRHALSLDHHFEQAGHVMLIPLA